MPTLLNAQLTIFAVIVILGVASILFVACGSRAD